MYDGQLVASSWAFTDHPEDIIRLGDRALWRKIKLKLISDFVEWSFSTGQEKILLSTAMIDNREALVTTLTGSVPDDFDVVAAHEVFMSRTRFRPND